MNTDNISQNINAIVHTPTNNLQESINFYKKLNYKVLSKENPVLLSDGRFAIEINPDRFARAGIKLYSESWKTEAEKLKETTPVYDLKNGYLLNDMNGCWIYLIEGELPVKFNIEESAYGLTGNFMGLSLEAANIKKSFDIWNILGFEVTMGSLEEAFVVLANKEGFAVSLMQPLSCPHLFFNPSLTFFNGKENLKIIENIRNAGIPITEEITHFNKEGIVDNIIIRDPGGYGFFIFSD